MVPKGRYRCRRYEREVVQIQARRRSGPPALTQDFPESLDQNHPESTGVGPRPLNNIDGVRMSTALTYLSQVRHRLNLTVRGGVMVHSILFEGKRAVGVEAESGGETFTGISRTR